MNEWLYGTTIAREEEKMAGTKTKSRPPDGVTTMAKLGRPRESDEPLPPFALRLKALREKAELTQQALADEAGIKISIINKIESGQRKHPRMDTLHRLARALGVDVSAFVQVIQGKPPQ